MKINKKILGILLSLGMISGFVVVASAKDNFSSIKNKSIKDILPINNKSVKDKSKFLAVEYVIKNKSMKPRKTLSVPTNYDNLTDEKDVVMFYMIVKKILKNNGLLTKEINERVLNGLISGDGKKLKLTTELDLFFDDEKVANKFKEVISKLNLNKMEITKDDFNEAIEDFKKHYNVTIERDEKEVKTYEKALKKGAKEILKEDIKKSEESIEKINKMVNETKSLEQRNNIESGIELENEQIEKNQSLIKQLDGEEKKSESFKGKIKSVENEAKEHVKKIKNFVKLSKDSVRKIINLKYDDVKDLKKDFKFNKELKNLRTGETF